MLVVNLRDGSTLRFDLASASGAEGWSAVNRSEITAVSVVHNRHVYAVPLRDGAAEVEAEVVFHRDGSGAVVAHRVTSRVEGSTVELLVYTGHRPRMARFTVSPTASAKTPEG